MPFRLNLSLERGRVRELLPYAGLAVFTLLILAGGIVLRENRIFVGLAITIVLVQLLWKGIGSIGFAVALAAFSFFLMVEKNALAGYVPVYLGVVLGVVLWVSRKNDEEVRMLDLAEDKEHEAMAEWTEQLDEKRMLIAGSRQRIERILMLTNVINDLTSTLDLNGIMRHALSWTRVFSNQLGSAKVTLFDDQGNRVFRIVDGVITIAREDPDSVSLWMRKSMMPLFVADLARDARFRETGIESSGVRSLIAAPLIRGKLVTGVLQVESEKAGTFAPEEARLISLMGDLTSVAIHNAQLYQRTHVEAITDGLTEVYVHRYFRERLGAELKRTRELEGVLTLLMVDIDNFKSFNDTYGHLTGDAVLKKIAQALREGVRGTDLIARYGGEEFAVLLVETSSEPGHLVAERLRVAVEALDFQGLGIRGPVTVSIGLACFPEHADDERGLIERADESLYVAKRQGKNRVVRTGS